MGNQFLNAQTYANVMLLLLKNNLVWGRLVDGQFKDQVTDENGLSVSIKRPPRFIDKKDGTANLVPQDLVVGSMPVSVTEYSKVHIGIGDIEYIQSFNALMKSETMKSAASTLAHSIDSYIAGLTLGFHSWVAGGDATHDGIDATDPTKPIKSALQAMSAHTRLMAQGVPDSSLSAVVGYPDGEKIRGSLQTNFTPGLNQTALQKTRIPVISEVEFYGTQQLPTLTTGTRTQGDGSSSGGQINTANQNVNYRDVKGSAATVGMRQNLVLKSVGNNATIKAGEVFTIQSVFAWDWRNQAALDYLQQFTVTADATADGSGNVTVNIQPAIIVPNTVDATGNINANTAFATVDSVPASNSYVQWAGAVSTKLRVRSAFNKRAISLVSAKLAMPFTGTASFQMDPETGIAIRYWRGSDIATGQHIHRWDCVYGAAVTDSFLGTRLCGQS